MFALHSLCSCSHTSFIGFAHAYNLMNVHPSIPLDRRRFEVDFLTYEWIRYCLFIGQEYAFTPRFSRSSSPNSFDQQFEKIIADASSTFTRFWSHVALSDTKCLVVDGTWKLRRPTALTRLSFVKA